MYTTVSVGVKLLAMFYICSVQQFLFIIFPRPYVASSFFRYVIVDVDGLRFGG